MYAGSYLKAGISFERNRIFSSTVLIKSLGDAFPMRKWRVFFLLSRSCMRWHFGPRKTAEMVLQSGFYWPILFKDTNEFCKTCSRCQMV